MSFAQKTLLSLLKKIQIGKITIQDGDNCYVFSGIEKCDSHAVIVKIYNANAYRRILWGGSIGSGKSYMDGDWDVDDLMKLLEIFILNSHFYSGIETPLAKLANLLKSIANRLKLNTIKYAKENILSHYDLGNSFFNLFLDETMMYSCAIYEPENIPLEQASKKKLMVVCEGLNLQPEDHLLEIGTGWGGLAIFAAQNYGCKVTTTTISDKQYAFVKAKIAKLSLEDRIELLNVDYRELKGQYDKLVSIEMIEAIGYQQFDLFFRQCNDLLKKEGMFFLQAIVMNDQCYENSKNDVDFIKQYIFPGGCLPSVASISESIANQTKMQLIQLRDIGKHYVNTLNHWHANLLKNINEIRNLGFSDEFIRMWKFYFCCSAAAFNSYHISDIQAIWRKRA